MAHKGWYTQAEYQPVQLKPADIRAMCTACLTEAGLMTSFYQTAILENQHPISACT